MKKVLLTLVCACALTLGTVFVAQAETTGVYVAPKFLMMWQKADTKMELPTGDAKTSGSQFTLGGALAVGYDFYPQSQLPISAEIEFAMRGNYDQSYDESYGSSLSASADTSFNAKTLMANFFWDFHNDSPFTPYLTAGAGLAFIHAENKGTGTIGALKYDVVDNSKDVTNFAWNVGAGVAYNFTENLAVDLGYRYLSMGTVSMSGTTNNIYSDSKVQLYNHEVMLGVRYTF